MLKYSNRAKSAPPPELAQLSRSRGEVDRKNYAFTLAEVLITLGIIGVVAAMTLPSLIAKYKEVVLVNQVKKAYSELQNALKLYAAKNDCADISCISDLNQTRLQLGEKLFEQFQNATKCQNPDSFAVTKSPCSATPIKSKTPYYKDGVTSHSDAFQPIFVSASGVSYHVIQFSECPKKSETTIRDENGFEILGDDNKPITQETTSHVCALFYIDANGTNKGPNQIGADIYTFRLNDDNSFVNSGNTIIPVLTKGKLEYTPYNEGVSKN